MKYVVAFLAGLAIAGGIGFAFYYDATHITPGERLDTIHYW